MIKLELEYNDNDTLVNHGRFRKAASEFQAALDMEESYWRQKAHCKWLLGDRNTSLFHSMVKRSRRKSKITNIEFEGKYLTATQKFTTLQ